MNNFDVAGILSTYANRALKARDARHLREIVLSLKSTLNRDMIDHLVMDDEDEHETMGGEQPCALR